MSLISFISILRLRRWRESEPSEIDSLITEAEIFAAYGRNSLAIKNLSRAIKLEPNNQRALKLLSELDREQLGS